MSAFLLSYFPTSLSVICQTLREHYRRSRPDLWNSLPQSDLYNEISAPSCHTKVRILRNDHIAS